MTADAEVVIARTERTLRVPSHAVMDGRRVYAARNGRAVAVEFDPGLRNWDWTEIRGGVGEGETVVATLDRPGLADGVRLKAREVGTVGAREDSTWRRR